MQKFILGLILLCLCQLSFAQTEFKIFTLQHRFASDLIPIIQPMVGEDGTVSGMNNQLIVRAQPSQMRDIETTVAQLDVARVNRKITVKSNKSLESQQERAEASGNVRVGKVTVGNNRRSPPNTGRVDVENNRTNQTQNSEQFIRVLDSEQAFIRVGQIVPYTQEWITLTRRFVNIERTTNWVEVTTGFAVRPRTIGNQVELEITPRIARLNSNQFIDFEELSTIVRAPLGEWVDIGSTMQAKDDVSRKILGFNAYNSKEKSQLSIKVD